MANIYELRRYGKIAFLIAAAAVVAMFLYFSSGLIRDLSAVERERMQIWADATKELVSATLYDEDMPSTDVEFLLGIIQSNTTIPVLLTDADGNILDHRNFDLPKPVQPGEALPDEDAEYLAKKLKKLAATQTES